jgi:hypothetical protein
MKLKHSPRGMLVLAATVAVALAGGVAFGAGGSPKADFVVGGGEISGCISLDPCPLPNVPFAVDAYSNKKGTNAHGTYTQVGAIERGQVTCVNVDGNTASVGGIIKKSSLPLVHPGEHFVIYFVDNGPPVNGVSPDLTSRPDLNPEANDPPLETLPPDFPNSCPSPVSPFGYTPVKSGDVIVQDATP